MATQIFTPNPRPTVPVNTLLPTRAPATDGQLLPVPAGAGGMGIVQMAQMPQTPADQYSPTDGLPTVSTPVSTPNAIATPGNVTTPIPVPGQAMSAPEQAAFEANQELRRQRMNRPQPNTGTPIKQPAMITY